MNSIKILDNLEVGMPVIVTTENQGYIMRKVCLYMGKDKENRYNFFDDDDGITGFAYSTKYIIDCVTIETEMNYTADLCTAAELCKKVIEIAKGVK